MFKQSLAQRTIDREDATNDGLQAKIRRWSKTTLAGLIAACGHNALAEGPTQIQHGGQNYAVVQASDLGAIGQPRSSAIPGGISAAIEDGVQQTAFSQTSLDRMIAQVGHHATGSGSCNQCGDSYNESCGTAGCYGGGMACPTCDPYYYGSFEALYMRREQVDDFSAARDFLLDEYDFELGMRVTLGSVPDCVNGTEVSFVGPLSWETRESSPLAFAGALSSNFLEDPNQPGTLLSFGVDTVGVPADEAETQFQEHESEFWAIEVNRTMIAWDVAKLLIGARYVNFEEDYRYGSTNGVDSGLLTSEVANRMGGIHVGADIFNPLGRFSSSFARLRAGGYWNSAESDVVVISEPLARPLVNNSDSDGDFAFMLEIGGGVRYQLGELLSVHVGTEAWYMMDVATATSNFQQTVTPNFGRRVAADEDVYFIGINLGAELKY
ncbi:MAG: hypothetical protein AAGD07_20755 [Planctomycetota bacterium]